jgi:hypothetical protein
MMPQVVRASPSTRTGAEPLYGEFVKLHARSVVPVRS